MTTPTQTPTVLEAMKAWKISTMDLARESKKSWNYTNGYVKDPENWKGSAETEEAFITAMESLVAKRMTERAKVAQRLDKIRISSLVDAATV